MERQLVSLPKFLEQKGRSRIWGWRMRKQGLPSRVINGKPYAVLPDADEWLLKQSTPDPVGQRA